MKENTYLLKDDLKLLQLMLKDSKFQPEIYKPGKYWINKTKISVKHIFKYGLHDFRGYSNLIGQSYSDNILLDIRKGFDLNYKKLVFRILFEKIYPFNLVFNWQVQLTKSFSSQLQRFKNENIINNSRTQLLLSKYKIPYSLLGGCVDFVTIDGEKRYTHYLNLLDQLDFAMQNINIKDHYCPVISQIKTIG